ncbi:hypothetical protein ZWY2020_029927 [Hordeum vulgare]|nr:hypothetical protein ZWY2020_029927 [Hordeum vulgare]
MAASHSSMARVPSRCKAETARATVTFEVAGYSLLKGLGRGKFLNSPAFTVGGYEWCIPCYPDGHESLGEAGEGYVSVFLQLLTENAEATAFFNFWLVLPRTAEIESLYLRNDCLVIECEVSVMKETFEVHVPPSDLSDNLAKLLEGEKGADVTFKVQGEVFSAHKILLAMRSTVFDAKFYGPMGDKEAHDISIDDMQPTVFKAFLHFIYTDSMPSMDNLDDDDRREMVKHLLVAADKYAMERMKMICEGMLCKSLDVETVATVLSLADQHHCTNLKDACIEFMLSSNRMNDVIASQGYLHLKRSSPDLIVDVLEGAAKSCKI